MASLKNNENATVEIFLHPGEYYIGGENCRIRTILGSCVSITLWHPVRRIGAMSHFILPHRAQSVHTTEFDARYGEEAMWLLLSGLIKLDVSPLECEAKIFGGGNMFPHQKRPKIFNVGERNGEIARSLLQAYKIPIVSESLFGEGHRHIIFNVNNGHVWTRWVKPESSVASMAEKE